MRIISKFHDYYDSAQAHGQDQSLVFVRQYEEYELGSARPFPAHVEWLRDKLVALLPNVCNVHPWTHAIFKCALIPGLVLFAGRLYPYIQAQIQYRALETPTMKKVFFDLKSLEQCIQGWGASLDLMAPQRFWAKPVRPSLTAFFALRGSDVLMQPALAHKVAIARVVHSSNISLEVNPVLRDCEFFKCLDAWQAFQELSMFVGNLAQPERPMTQISERDKAAKHGFDEWSFRKMPQAHK